MSPIPAAILAVLAYTGMNVLFKRHAGAGGNTVALTAWLGLLTPFWGLALFLGAPPHLLNLPANPAYWTLTALWAVLLPATTLLTLHLFKTLSLIEVTAARKALTTLFAIAVDALLLHTSFTMPTLFGVAIITIAALALPTAPSQSPHALPPPHAAALLALLAALLTLQLLAYKQALAYQPDLPSHIIIAKFLASLFCLPLFLLIPKNTHHRPTVPLILAVAACYLLGSVAEGFALRGLPLTVLIAVTTATAALMAAHDLWRKDLPRTPRTLALLAVIFAGFVILALSR